MDDLKAIYSVIVWWWEFIKANYGTEITDKKVSKWIDDAEAKSREIKTDDEGLAWLYRHIGIVCLDYLTKVDLQKKGKEGVFD